jgi:transposase
MKTTSSEPVRNFLESVESLVSPPVRVIRGALMWTNKNRARYECMGLRYPSDLTDEEYTLIEPFLPPERTISRRSLVNGILYVLTTGCQWRQLPKDFPPKSTTHDYFVELQCAGVLKHYMPRCGCWRAGPQRRHWRSLIARP